MIEKLAAARGVTVEEAKQKMLAQIGVTRYGQPEEIAELMAFLVSPGARWMTGASLRMDGGEVKAI
jgi:3-oxoacyl-[acyl-carrier protein] reductase